VGSAFVSPKHANFFQADEGGSADDVRALILEVQRRVEASQGVRLHPELQMVGFAEAEAGDG
jgi:UDP-N-acetylmuramate dehydrogenase